MRKENRFEVIYTEGTSLSDNGQKKIMVDKETGVTYLVWKSGYAGGITSAAIDGIKVAEELAKIYK